MWNITKSEGTAFVFGFAGGYVGDVINQWGVEKISFSETNWSQGIQSGLNNGAVSMIAVPFTTIPDAINDLPKNVSVADKAIAQMFCSGVTITNELVFDVYGYYS